MRLSRRLAAVHLMVLLVSTASAKAAEPLPTDASSGLQVPARTLIIPEDSSKGVSDDLTGAKSSKATFANATPAIRFAPCGVEADAGNSNLDAGLIDFNVPDPARAAGRSSDDQRDAGRNVGDYRSSVVLGVTLGYRF